MQNLILLFFSFVVQVKKAATYVTGVRLMPLTVNVYIQKIHRLLSFEMVSKQKTKPSKKNKMPCK